MKKMLKKMSDRFFSHSFFRLAFSLYFFLSILLENYFLFFFGGKKPVNNIDLFLYGFEQTTLLNHILTADHGKRIAVIENEVWNQSSIAQL